MRKMVLLMVILSVLLWGCGKVSGVEIEIGESELYSEHELQQAADLVVRQFQKGFESCKLLNIRYDEEDSLRWAADWAAQFDAEEAIVLYSDFLVIGSGNPTLNSNSKYEDWSWVLVCSGGSWELKTWGYG